MSLDETLPVDKVMSAWPAAVAVFLRWRLHCVGCPAGRFHDVADACVEHGIALEPFLADLRRAASGDDGAAGMAGNDPAEEKGGPQPCPGAR